MNMVDTILVAACGALGGAILGLKGYVENRKKDSNEKFDVAFFLQTLVAPIIVGVFAGLVSATPTEAFLGGMMGKALQEMASTLTK